MKTTELTGLELGNIIKNSFESAKLKIDVLTLDQLSSELEKSRSHLKRSYHTILVTGPSGSGKSHLATQISGRLKAHLLRIDSFGRQVEQQGKHKWICDWNKLGGQVLESGLTIIEGTCDNMSDINRHMPNSNGVSIVVIPVQSLAGWQKIQAAKARDFAKHDSFNQEWADDWTRKSKMSRSEYLNYICSKVELVLKFTTPFRLVLVHNSSVEKLERVDGWFK